ncbi:MAG: YceI family protein [Balneolaceae bacterium]|nr:YceI family protein [Balneolaceae bacterium]
MNILLSLIVSLFCGVCEDVRQDVVYITDSGHAEFTSRVPLHTFTGSSDHLHGLIDFDENLVDFYLDLSTLKSGIGRRDRDIYRTLNVDDHPFAEFTGSLSSSFDINSSEIQQVAVRGEFTIHGVTREITIEGTLQKQGGELHLTAEWILDLEDYDIEPPGILFYRVDEEQELRIEAILNSSSRE